MYWFQIRLSDFEPVTQICYSGNPGLWHFLCCNYLSRLKLLWLNFKSKINGMNRLCIKAKDSTHYWCKLVCLPTTYLHLPNYQLTTNYLPTTYLLPTYYLPTTYLLPTYYLPTTYLLPTYYLPTTYLLPTYYLPITYSQSRMKIYKIQSTNRTNRNLEPMS